MNWNLLSLKMRSGAIAIFLFALSAWCVGLLLGGCSDNGVVPTSTDSEDNVSFFDLPYDGDAVAKRADIVEAQVRYIESGLQASLGGVIALGDDDNVEAFVVLPNSFPADTTFSIEVTKIVTTDGEMPVVYEFGPDGLVFSRPAVLRLSLTELFDQNTTAIDLYWLNEETNSWIYQMTCDADDQQVVYASIDHFSSYGAKPKSGSGTVPLATDAK